MSMGSFGHGARARVATCIGCALRLTKIRARNSHRKFREFGEWRRTEQTKRKGEEL